MSEQNVITKFYTAFGQRDYKTMQECYAPDATFSDPVFGKLNAEEVKTMWEMLLKRAPDLEVTFSDVVADNEQGSAKWVAKYTFSATGKKVVNRVTATFGLRDGQIVQHDDVFNFYTWSKQSLGLTGLLLGKTKFLKNKISTQARKGLDAFMKKK